MGFFRKDPKDALLEEIMHMKIRKRYLRCRRDHYIRKSSKALRNGDKADSELYKQRAIETEKARRLLVKNIHDLESMNERKERDRDLVKTAKIVVKARKKIKVHEEEEKAAKALAILARAHLEDEMGNEAINEALKTAELEPEEAENFVAAEIKSRVQKDMHPEEEAIRLRKEIDREREKAG